MLGRSVRDEARLGIAARTVASQRFHSSVSRACATRGTGAAPDRAASSCAAARGRSRLEVLLAVHAVAVAALRRPAVGEDAVDLVSRDDLAVDLVHELEVVGTERAGHPQLGVGPVPPRLAVAVDGDPVGMRGPHVVAHGVRIGARDDVHAERAAAGDQRAERIARAQPGAAMVQRNLGGVVGDDAAGAERGGVGVEPRK